MAETKRVLRFYQYNQCDQLAVYLNDMARKGWHFKEFKLGMVFEKGEPEEAFYDVAVMSNRDANDREVNDDDLDLADYCEAAGWELIDATDYFCVFKRVEEDAIPIVSDEEKVETILHIAKTDRIVYLLVGLLGIMLFAMELYHLLSDLYESWYYSTFSVSELVEAFPSIIFGIWGLISNFIQCRKLKLAIDQGKDIFVGRKNKKNPAKPVYPHNLIMIWLTIFVIINLISSFIDSLYSFNLMTIAWIAVFGIQIIGSYKREHRKKSLNKVLVIMLVCYLVCMISIPIDIFVLKDDEEIPKAPLNPTEIMHTDKKYTEWDSETYESSILGNHYEYTFSFEDDDDDDLFLSYQVYHTRFSSLIQHTWDYNMDKEEGDWYWQGIKKIDAPSWGAEEVYETKWDYYIRYKHTIVIITKHDYTKNQIQTIKQKLEVN